MKIELQTEKLKKLFEIAFIDKEFSDTILRFNKNGLMVNDVTTIKGLGVVAIFLPEYFDKFEVKESVDIIVPGSFQTALKTRAFKAATIEFYDDGEKLHMKSGKEHYKEIMRAIPDDKDSKEQYRLITVVKTAKKEFGLVPEKGYDPQFIGTMKLEDLHVPGTNEDFYIKSDGNQLQLYTSMVGEYTRDLVAEQVIKPVDLGFEYKYDTMYFQSVIKQFIGNCTFIINKLNDDGYLLLTEKTTEYYLLMLLGEKA